MGSCSVCRAQFDGFHFELCRRCEMKIQAAVMDANAAACEMRDEATCGINLEVARAILDGEEPIEK